MEEKLLGNGKLRDECGARPSGRLDGMSCRSRAGAPNGGWSLGRHVKMLVKKLRPTVR